MRVVEPLIAGDVAMNILGLGDPVGFENEAEARYSQRKIAGLRFEAAVFGYGSPIRFGASERVRQSGVVANGCLSNLAT